MDLATSSPSIAGRPSAPGARNQLGMGGPMPRAGRNFGGGLNGFNGGNGLQIQIGPNGQIFGNGFGGNIGVTPVPGVKPGSGKDDGNGNKSTYLYDKDGNITGWYSSQSWSWPPSNNNGNGNNGGNAFPQPGAGGNVFDAMDQINRQMSEMMRPFNSPAFGGFGGMEDSFTITPPQGLNQRKILPAPQQKKFTSPNKELPAYTDPNSI